MSQLLTYPPFHTGTDLYVMLYCFSTTSDKVAQVHFQDKWLADTHEAHFFSKWRAKVLHV